MNRFDEIAEVDGSVCLVQAGCADEELVADTGFQCDLNNEAFPATSSYYVKTFALDPRIQTIVRCCV